MFVGADTEYNSESWGGDGSASDGGWIYGKGGSGDDGGAGDVAEGHADHEKGVCGCGGGSNHGLDCFKWGGKEEYSSA